MDAQSTDGGEDPVVVRLALPGGSNLVVRRPSPADEEAVAALYRALPTEDTYTRFFSLGGISRATLHGWMRLNPERGERLLALMDDEVVGDCGFFLTPGLPDEAEPDIVVRPSARGWLGPYLLDLLVNEAAERGVRNLRASVLHDNRRMLGLLSARGFVGLPSDDPGVVSVMLGTTERLPAWSGAGPTDTGGEVKARLLVEAMGSGWHGARVAATFGFDVRVCSWAFDRGGRRCPARRGETCPLAAGADAILITLPETGSAREAVIRHHDGLQPPPLVGWRGAQTTDPDHPRLDMDPMDDRLGDIVMHALDHEAKKGRTPCARH